MSDEYKTNDSKIVPDVSSDREHTIDVQKADSNSNKSLEELNQLLSLILKAIHSAAGDADQLTNAERTRLSAWLNGDERKKVARTAALIKKTKHVVRGKELNRKEAVELWRWLQGESWFQRLFLLSEEEKIIRAQTMMLGADLRKALERVAKEGQLSREDRIELGQWLGTARRTKRRYRLAWTVWLLLLGVMAFGLGLAIPSFLHLIGLKDNPLTLPFVVSVVILTVALIKDIILDRTVEAGLREIKAIAEKTKEDTNSTIEKNLRPRIVPLDNREKVVTVACEILKEAAKEQDDNNRFVMFIGAASLSTDQQKGRDEDIKTPETEYQLTLNSLEQNKVRVDRYIALIEEGTIADRQEDILCRYEPWLQKQIDLLDNNRNYVLKNCRRAQPYEGSRSSIITNKAVLDIVGFGDSGFLIKDEEVARAIRVSSERLFTQKAKIHASYYGNNPASIKPLRDLYKAVKGRKKKNDHS